MAEIGHPVCGERVYSAPRHFKIKDTSEAPRVMLHAAELGFIHPESGDELRFESPLPADMQRLLNYLRREHAPK
jgi:23S rRNA pseudouridine1911/1915/1917 synthase